MYPLCSYHQSLNLDEDQFQGDADHHMSKEEAIQVPDHDTFLNRFHQTPYFSDDAHYGTIWGNSISKMNCDRLVQEGLINLPSSSSPLLFNSRKRKAEAIEVHGASRKDKHSKVCTARGPRDRRVRLSPKTAIQFYDVQDRLGYDRPSKAIDWLIKEAKTAIDALDEQQPPLGSDNQSSAANHSKFQIVSECFPIGKQEDLDDKYEVSSFGFFVDNNFNPSGNRSKAALEEAMLNPGYQQGFISGLATDSQTLDTTWEVARVQTILTVDESSDDARAEGVEYSSFNSQSFCQAEALQSSAINYSPIGITFPGFSFSNLSNELSNVTTAAAILQEGAKEKTDLSKTSFLKYQVSGGISVDEIEGESTRMANQGRHIS